MAQSNSQEDLSSIGEDVSVDSLTRSQEESEIFNEQNKRSKNKHKHIVFIVSLYVLMALAILVMLLRSYHFVAPLSWQWMDSEQLQALDKLLFTGAVGSILGRYGKNLIA